MVYKRPSYKGLLVLVEHQFLVHHFLLSYSLSQATKFGISLPKIQIHLQVAIKMKNQSIYTHNHTAQESPRNARVLRKNQHLQIKFLHYLLECLQSFFQGLLGTSRTISKDSLQPRKNIENLQHCTSKTERRIRAQLRTQLTRYSRFAFLFRFPLLLIV